MSVSAADPVFDALEDRAVRYLDVIDEFLTYSGGDRSYYHRARVAAGQFSAYAKLRGTRANERQLALLERRIASGEVVPATPAALAAPQDQQDTGNSGVDAPAADQASAVGARKGGRKS